VIETDPSVYEWNPGDELTVYDVPATPAQRSYIPASPTGMTLTSSLATALIGLDGVVQPRVEVQWVAPLDISVTQILIQHRQHRTGQRTLAQRRYGQCEPDVRVRWRRDLRPDL
jgi:hypothetical protein